MGWNSAGTEEILLHSKERSLCPSLLRMETTAGNKDMGPPEALSSAFPFLPGKEHFQGLTAKSSVVLRNFRLSHNHGEEIGSPSMA